MKEFFTDATSATNFAQKAKAVPSRFNGTTVHTWVGKKLMRVRNAHPTIMMLTHRTIRLNYHASFMVVMFFMFLCVLSVSCTSYFDDVYYAASIPHEPCEIIFPHDSYDSYASNEF